MKESDVKIDEIRKTIKSDGTVIVHGKNGSVKVFKPGEDRGEFDNVQSRTKIDLQKYLWKVQTSRTHHYCEYFNDLKDKYPNWPAVRMNFSTIKNYAHTMLAPTKEIKHNVRLGTKELTEQELDKLVFLYGKMIDAKKQYEKEGGKYETR